MTLKKTSQAQKKHDKFLCDLESNIQDHTAVTINDIVKVETTKETFVAIRLPWRDIAGCSKNNSFRYMRLDRHSPEIGIINTKFLVSINGVPYHQKQNSWIVTSDSGQQYKVRLVNDKLTCTCKGFTFRKKCKHIEQIKNDNK